MIANVRRRAISGGIVVELGRNGLLHHVQRSGLDQFDLRRLEPDLMEFGGLAEDFSDVQFDKAIVEF